MKKQLGKAKEQIRREMGTAPGNLAGLSGRTGYRYCFRPRQQQAEEPGAKEKGIPAPVAGAVGTLQGNALRRSNYSKTDPDATFVRMKEDHRRNGQIKPG